MWYQISVYICTSFKNNKMKGTKEYYEIQEAFEKYLIKSPIYTGCAIVRADKDAKHFYENGKVNDLFLMFMCGVSLGKIL